MLMNKVITQSIPYHEMLVSDKELDNIENFAPERITVLLQ